MTRETYSASKLLLLVLSACTLSACGYFHGAKPVTAPVLADTPASAPQVRALPIDEATVAQLQAWMADGQLSAHALTQHYLARIDALDRNGPKLNSVIELNPDALSIADSLDAERKAGTVRGPLHGIPVLLKDNIATADAMQTTAGSLALVGHKPPRDAFIVERLRAAGAVILGKTNLSEWANWRSTHSSSGWSGRGGQTKNPYVLDRNPCGSSAGSGAAIAANLAAIAVGTETDGSIVCPSSVSGLVGIKPTVGRVSRSGIIPISASQDTAGPMARTVADAVILFEALAAPDQNDAATAASRKRAEECFHCALDDASVRGVRIGVLRAYAGFHPEVDAAFEQALATLKAGGAVIIDKLALPNDSKYGDDETTVLKYEFKDGINRYLATLGEDAPKTLADLIEFNLREAGLELPYFGQELFEQSQASGPLTTPAYRKARARSRRLAGRAGIDALLRAEKLDVLIAPTLGPSWPTDHVNGDHVLGGSISTAPAVAGYPHITVPMGYVRGLPVGLSFVGPAWSERRLIAYAYAYEQASKVRRPPEFRPSIP
jgi:amidase